MLLKHPNPRHLVELQEIIDARGYQPAPAFWIAEPSIRALIDGVQQPVRSSTVPAEVRDSHERAVAELERALANRLPFGVYLRNFDYANEIYQLGPTFSVMTGDTLNMVTPQVSYSLVDHKILEWFPEGVVGVIDPSVSGIDKKALTGHARPIARRETLIPMLVLREAVWKSIVPALIGLADRIVMLIDNVTPGVDFELAELVRLKATRRTLIVTGQAYRSGRRLPRHIIDTFPYVGDWVDVSYNEMYHDQRLKTHGMIQDHWCAFSRRS